MILVVCNSSSKTPVVPCFALHLKIIALMTQVKICPTMLHIQMVATTTLPPRAEEVCLHKNHLTLMDYKIRVQVCFKNESMITMEEATAVLMKMKAPTTPPQRKVRIDITIIQMLRTAKSLPWLHRTVVKIRPMKLLRKIKGNLEMMIPMDRWEEEVHHHMETPMETTRIREDKVAA